MKFATCARYGNVEAFLSARTIERTEVHGELAGKIRPERHREQHHVSFVALYVLQVLRNHRFLALVGEEPLKVAVSPADLVEQIED